MAWDEALVLKLVELHEGYRRFPYKDSVGVLTVGIGFNLDHTGLSRKESLLILEHRLRDLRFKLVRKFPEFGTLSAVRQAVIVDMAYNLGLDGLAKFRRMWRAIARKDWTAARSEMLDSKWANQVGARSRRLAKMMETSEWPEDL